MVLRTEDLVKKYRTRTVVNHVSIDVKQGEIVGLLGPNGAGKTTTFYMTVGLVTPNEGKIFLNDTEITKFPVYQRARHGIGYLAQEASIFRKMTVEDNIRTVLEMTPLTPEQQQEKSTARQDYDARKDDQKKLRKARKALEECEKRIASMEERIAELDSLLMQPENASDMTLVTEYTSIKKKLDEENERWFELAEGLE